MLVELDIIMNVLYYCNCMFGKKGIQWMKTDNMAEFQVPKKLSKSFNLIFRRVIILSRELGCELAIN